MIGSNVHTPCFEYPPWHRFFACSFLRKYFFSDINVGIAKILKTRYCRPWELLESLLVILFLLPGEMVLLSSNITTL